MSKHPMQKVIRARDGVIRFTPNLIVQTLIDYYPGGMNSIATRFMMLNHEDYEQFTMLIGYSVSGFGDLSTSSKERIRSADRAAHRIVTTEPRKSR